MTPIKFSRQPYVCVAIVSRLQDLATSSTCKDEEIYPSKRWCTRWVNHSYLIEFYIDAYSNTLLDNWAGVSLWFIIVLVLCSHDSLDISPFRIELGLLVWGMPTKCNLPFISYPSIVPYPLTIHWPLTIDHLPLTTVCCPSPISL